MSFITFPARIEGASYKNTGIGFDALYRVVPAPPQGEDNTAFGYAALQLNTSGDSNTAVGSGALSLNITGRKNTAIGENVLDSNDSGEFNTSIGANSLSSAIDADYNVAVGANALANFSSAGLTYNTAVGAGAGQLITTGTKNTILGRYNGNQGGLDIRTLSNYCVISDGDGNPRIIVDPTGLVSAPGGFSGGGGGGGAITIDNKTSAYTVVSADLGKVINCTANTFTVSLTAAATLGAGFNCWVWNTGTGAITIDPSGAETIDGVSTVILRQGEGTQIVCTGTEWLTGDKKTMRGYADNIQSTQTRPSVSGTNSAGIGPGTIVSGTNAFAAGYFPQATANNTTAVGYGAQATGTGANALGYDASASGVASNAIGANSGSTGSRALGQGSTAIGGSRATGTDSFAVAGSTNVTPYGASNIGAVAIGRLATASATDSVAIGNAATASGFAAIALGSAIASGSRSLAWGVSNLGVSAIASATESVALGESCRALQQRAWARGWGAVADVYGKEAYASGVFANNGDAQRGYFTLRGFTANATPQQLTSNGAAASATNQLNLRDNYSAITFSGIVVARRNGFSGTESAAWKIEGLARREGGAGTTTLVASSVTVISNAPGWGLALAADTTNGAVSITATGAVGFSIQWVANVETAETTFA